MKRVLIALRMAGVAGQKKLHGIFSYLGRSHDWETMLVRTASEFTPRLVSEILAASCDGCIVSLPGAADAVALLARSDVPMVALDLHEPALHARRRNIVFIHNSPRQIGATAAHQLMNIGRCRSYAFVHSRAAMEWSVDRFKAFRRTLAEHGLQAHELDSPAGLLALERPTGVFVANDDRGSDVLEFCRERHIAVPDEMLVLSINNEPLICENTTPKLSSIEPDFFNEGFASARELDAMMKAPAADSAPRTITVGVSQIVDRESLREVSGSGKLVQQMLAFIRSHRRERISVGDVAAAAGCSRRLADLRFRELMGSTIGETIISERLDEVRRLLETSKAPIDDVASICGFANPNYLKNLFKKRFGMPMRAWRRAGHALARRK